MSIREKWLRFYDMTSTQRTMIHIYYAPGLPPRPLPTPDNEAARIQWSVQRYENMLERARILPDDQIPFLSTYTGTELFAQAFGCPVHFPKDNNPFALPLIHSATDVPA